MRRVCTVVMMAAILTGCISPKLTRHYDTGDDARVSSGGLTLSVFLADPKVDEEAPLISKLSERRRAELIRDVASIMPTGNDATALLNILGTAAADKPTDCAWADRTSLKRGTMTVLGNLRRPANRIDRLEFHFSLPPDHRYEFTSWDKFDSAYGSYDLGSAKYTQCRKLTLGDTHTATKNLPNDAGNVVGLLSAGYEGSGELEEDIKYAIRRMSVGGALQTDRATLVQQGGPDVNLLGGSSAVFTIKLKPTGDPLPVYLIEFKNGRKTLPEDVTVTLCQARYPVSRAPLFISIGGSALKRLVVNHDDTISEGDDTVRLKSQEFAPSTARIANEAELKAEFFPW